jgi:hypothetical protein
MNSTPTGSDTRKFDEYDKLKAEHAVLKDFYQELLAELKYVLTHHNLWDEEGYYTLPNGNTYERDR